MNEKLKKFFSNIGFFHIVPVLYLAMIAILTYKEVEIDDFYFVIFYFLLLMQIIVIGFTVWKSNFKQT
ncbi:hypothetical protein AAA799B03_00119 [Marine Group I thaumarchaeote SCGC AAA799-B03]|uniref:Uncharacterized protein n=1 Tax=Marine Group I thaumarchaeote SCGC AAA799-B03 TaxID=1502289 RepID=A0A087S915_9ARCH|nr:hypothetical protein AAA799B03_00119 [Marine Group I thaumarchaeote SCGC AAA799-B03]